jgi:hypothetical protein
VEDIAPQTAQDLASTELCSQCKTSMRTVILQAGMILNIHCKPHKEKAEGPMKFEVTVV